MWFFGLSAILVGLGVLRFLRRKSLLGPIDALYYNMDPDAVVAPHSMVRTSSPVPVDLVRKELQEHFLVHRVFKQRVIGSSWAWPYWEDCPDFNLDNHLKIHTQPMRQAELEEYIAVSLRTSYDKSKPLWCFEVFNHYIYTDDDTGEERVGAINLLHFHHCIADGITILKVVLGIANKRDVPPKPKETAPKSGRKRRKKPGIGKTIALAPSAVKNVLLPPSDPSSPIKQANRPRPAHSPISVHWSKKSISIPRMKEASRICGVTMNDLMLAAVSSSVSRYIAERTEKEGRRPEWAEKLDDVKSLVWVSRIPLNLDGDHKNIKFGNYLGIIYLSVPTCALNTLMERAKIIGERVAHLMGTPEPVVSSALQSFFGLLPAFLVRPVWNNCCFNASLSISTVPGPRIPLSFCTADVDRIQFAMPPLQALAVFVTMFSYCDKLVCSFNTDASVVPDSAPLVQYFSEAIDGLCAEAGVPE